MQRVTSIALVPLTLWFAFAVAALGGADYPALIAWVQSPVVTVLLILLIVTAVYHMHLGLRVIIEDYVHLEWLKISGILLVGFANVVLAVVGVVAVLTIFLDAAT